MTTWISINKHVIASNARHGKDDPAVRIARDSKNATPEYCHELEILGPSRLITGEGGKPVLKCGARLALATEADVRIVR